MRIGDKVYISKRIYSENAEMPTYEPPCWYVTRPNYLTVMPAANRYMMMMEYGESVNRMWVATANTNYFHGKFEEGDLLWVDGEEPNEKIETTYGFGSSANAVVKSVSEGNMSIMIVLESNGKRVCK